MASDCVHCGGDHYETADWIGCLEKTIKVRNKELEMVANGAKLERDAALRSGVLMTYCEACMVEGHLAGCPTEVKELKAKVQEQLLQIGTMTKERDEARRLAKEEFAQILKDQAEGERYNTLGREENAKLKTTIANISKGRDQALAQCREMADKLEEQLRLVDRLKNLLMDVSNAWWESWDCSASPGHPKMDPAIQRAQDYLASLLCREQIPPSGEPCGEKLPCPHHKEQQTEKRKDEPPKKEEPYCAQCDGPCCGADS